MKLIYAIQHNKTKRIYIGCTENTSRINKHFSDLKGNRHIVPLMQKDCNDYGLDFSVYALEIVDGRGFESERKWMQYFGTCDERYGYNYRDKMALTDNVVDRREELCGFPTYSEVAWFGCMNTGNYINIRMKSSRNETEFRTKVISQMKLVGYDTFMLFRRCRYSEKKLKEMLFEGKPISKSAMESIAKAIGIELID